MIVIQHYNSQYQNTWNNYNHFTNNGTFLFNRSYMDYHANRFTDCSFLIYYKGYLCGLFPASIQSNVVTSHAGLPYGGLITHHRGGHLIKDMIQAITYFLADKLIIWKPVPLIFHEVASEAEDYWLKQVGYKLIDEKVSSCIPSRLSVSLNMQEKKRRLIEKSQKYPIEFSNDIIHLREFWDVLEENLASRHNTKPTHTFEEMQLLQSRFPDDIQLEVALYENHVIAGAILYNITKVCHTQYLATNEKGKELGALNLLIHRLITKQPNNIISMGHSHERNGDLNQGLYNWKSRFDCTEVICRTYQIGG